MATYVILYLSQNLQAIVSILDDEFEGFDLRQCHFLKRVSLGESQEGID